MRYPAPKTYDRLESRSVLLDCFANGINDDTGETVKENDQLKECLNMEYTGDCLTTRPGFTAKDGYVTAHGEYDNTVYLDFTVTDTVCYVNSVPENLAYCCTGYADGATLYFYLVDSKGNISPAGSIVFYRLDSEHFYTPQNVFFTVSQRIDGSGVFAFIYRKSGNDEICETYEATSDFSGWASASDRYYVPTVSINGRGENYDTAHTSLNLSFPEPRRLEDLNILTGKYRCYFTSDGFSCYFRLPYGNIPALSSLSCRVYSAPDTYTEWIIPSLGNQATATFSGGTVYLYLDRTLGILRFWKSPEDYSVPYMPRCKLNNIVVTAETGEDEVFLALMSSKGAVSLNNRLYCFGNLKRQNCIFCAKTETPLYFPRDSKLFLGDGTTPVTSLKVQNGKLIAFKPGETYRVITSAENASGIEIDLPESSEYLKGDVMTAQTIDNRIGCQATATLRLCGNRLVWLASDGAVYALATTTYGNTTNIFRVSQPIAARLKEALLGSGTVFAVTNGGQYLLFIGKTVFAMNHRVRGFGYSKTYYAHDDDIKSPAWFVWTLPQNVSFTGGSVVDSSPVLISKLNDGLSFYAATQGGSVDTSLKKENGEIITVSSPYKSGFTTKFFDCKRPDRKKSIAKLLAVFEGTGLAEITLFDGKNRFSSRIKSDSRYDLLPFLAGVPSFKKLSVSLFSDEPISVGSVYLNCKVLN